MIQVLTARWVLPIASAPIGDGAVAIDRDGIVAVSSLQDIKNQFPHAEIRNFGEAAILPGFINVHTHLELTAFRGRLEEPHFQSWILKLIRLKAERVGAEDLLESSRLGCIEAIRAGITTAADTSDAYAPLEALIESGQRGVIFQECFGPAQEQAESSMDQLRARLDAHAERLAKAPRGGQSRLRIGVSPHAPYSVSARLYEMTARFAIDNRLDVAIHAAESADEARMLVDGSGSFGDSLRRREIRFDPPNCSTIKYFDRLGVLETSPLLIHCVTVDDEDIELMARSDSRAAHCPKSNAKLGHGVAPLSELRRAGVRVGLGTDSVASNNACDLIDEARFCSLIHRAARKDAFLCPPDEMLRMMTIDGARALNLENEIGTIEAGKQADLIAIDLSNARNTPHYDPAAAIIFSCSASDVALTMVAGRVIYDGLQVTTIDEAHVLNRTRAIASNLS